MRTIRASLAALAAASAFGSPLQAQDEAIGKQLYEANCAVCHGTSGQGDGDMSSLMTIPATNLTLLSQTHDGVFPMLKVIHIIDGRSGLRAHGNPMPVFANTFGAALADAGDPYGATIAARGKVMSVALYLESLQR